MIKPDVISQLQTATGGLARLGGIASRGSTPVAPSLGSKSSAMENAMLKQLRPKPKALAKGKATRQFKKGSGEDTGQM